MLGYNRTKVAWVPFFCLQGVLSNRSALVEPFCPITLALTPMPSTLALVFPVSTAQTAAEQGTLVAESMLVKRQRDSFLCSFSHGPMRFLGRMHRQGTVHNNMKCLGESSMA